jgi:hypothetical protein
MRFRRLIQKAKFYGVFVVLPHRIELWTSPLPRGRSHSSPSVRQSGRLLDIQPVQQVSEVIGVISRKPDLNKPVNFRWQVGGWVVHRPAVGIRFDVIPRCHVPSCLCQPVLVNSDGHCSTPHLIRLPLTLPRSAARSLFREQYFLNTDLVD